jgi:hypothetical protein
VSCSWRWTLRKPLCYEKNQGRVSLSKHLRVGKRVSGPLPVRFHALNFISFNSKKHVAQGAVLTRLYARNGFISSRPIMRSKAVLTWMQVDDSIRGSPIYDLLDTYKDERNKVEYFYAAQWLVKQVSRKFFNRMTHLTYDRRETRPCRLTQMISMR